MARNEAEYGIKVRLLRIMRALLERPHGYTLRQLADIYKKSKGTIKNDFRAFKDAGFVLDYDTKFRYAFVQDQPYKELKDLLHFSEEEQFILEEAIDQIERHTKRGKRLKAKLGSLYNYRKLGHSYLRRPYLSKVDLLVQAQKEGRRVYLEAYRSSNSNTVSNRYVEPFHISPPDDMLHAFDVEKKALRHFRISRFVRVRLTEKPWEYEDQHSVMRTDVFRIVESKQVMVHLRLGVGAYNELVERFPLTKAYIQEDTQQEKYDFQAMVNHRFWGVTNFILGYYHQGIEVLEPESLLQHLRQTIEQMDF